MLQKTPSRKNLTLVTVPDPVAHFADFLAAHPALAQSRLIGIALSGGGDSVALAHLAASAAAAHGWELCFLHVNYGLRGPASDADEHFSAHLAHQLGARFLSWRPTPSTSAEEELRHLRYQWFASLPLDAILTGHTLDDQAETVLFRLLRGTGPAGLAGIQPVLANRVYRPLLACSRENLRTWLAAANHPWREDGSNANPAYRRNFIRHELLPQIEAHLNPSVASTLASFAQIAREEELWLDSFTRDLLPHYSDPSTSVSPRDLILRTADLAQAPRALQRRLLLLACSQVLGHRLQLEFKHVEAILALIARPSGDGRIQIPGLDLLRSFDWLRIQPLADAKGLEERNYRVPFAGPGEIPLPFGAGQLHATVVKRCTYNEDGSGVNWQVLSTAGSDTQPLEIRNWRPGDSYRRPQSLAEEKIKELFQRHRIPLWQRRSWPILVLGDTPIWAKEFGPAAGFQPTSDSDEVLELQWSPQKAS